MHNPGKVRYLKLTAILLLAILVRLPGVFWGVQTCDEPRFINYHPDEPHIVSIAREFINGVTNRAEFYPKGFPAQIGLISSLISPFTEADDQAIIIIGRMLSLVYGVMTVLIIYLLSRELFPNPGTALISSLFLCLSGLHVTQSHFATVDAGNTFWFYSTVFCCLLYCRRREEIYFLLAVISSACALAFKLSWVSILPVFYVLIRLKKGVRHYLLFISGISLFFIMANGGRYDLDNFSLTLKNVLHDNISIVAKHNKYLNPLVYLLELIIGLGFPVFLLSLHGARRLFISKTDHNHFFKGEIFALITAPVLLYFVSVSFLDIPFARQILPMVPAVILLAAYGFTEITGSKPFRRRNFSYLLFFLILLYQLISVGSSEYYFISDTREAAGAWIKNNISTNEEVTATPYVIVPYLKKYKIEDSFESRYIILHEAYYYRFIRIVINPFKEYPDWKEIYHGSYDHFVNIQRLFRGDLHYELVKKFEVKAVTPEMIVYKRFWGTYPQFIGDLLIYKKTEGL
jgi:hypothetical protein